MLAVFYINVCKRNVMYIAFINTINGTCTVVLWPSSENKFKVCQSICCAKKNKQRIIYTEDFFLKIYTLYNVIYNLDVNKSEFAF